MKLFIILFLFLSGCTSLFRRTEKSPQQISWENGKIRQQHERLAPHYMISTQGPHATQAGVDILRQGGSLFDAFTAVSFVMAVERPQSTGIAGGGFVIFHHAQEKKIYALDFRETAPQKSHSKMFLKPDGKVDSQLSISGGLSVATPGFVKGVLEVHQKYGKLKLAQVLAPAIRLAEQGLVVNKELNHAITVEKLTLEKFPSSRSLFLDPQGRPWPVGHNLKQPDLAKTLRLISRLGEKAFYEGAVADKIVSTVTQHKGVLSHEDLKNYRTKWRPPVRSTYKNYEIYSQPPPSSGGTHVIQILNIVEPFNLKSSGPQSPRSLHLTATAMQKAFVDRARYMGDPDFSSIPVETLVSKDYARDVRKRIDEHKAKRQSEWSRRFPPPAESPETVHFSMADIEGNMIASTQTINGFFGSGIVVEGTGIVLNNEMDDFAAQIGATNLYGAVGGKQNLAEPNKRPLSSMSPTLVLQNKQPILAVGTPSGTRIITCVALTLLNVLEYELPLWESVTASRYHHQWQPDKVFVEPQGFSSSTLDQLIKMGHKVEEKDLGCRIQAVRRTASQLQGVSDPRGEGSSQGF